MAEKLPIRFNKKTTPRVEEAKINSWGFTFINEHSFYFIRERIKIISIGTVPPQLTNRLEVTLKIERYPLLDINQVHRETIDLYSPLIDKYIVRVKSATGESKMSIKTALNDFTDRLEQYIQDKSIESDRKPLIKVRGAHKPSFELTKLLGYKNTRKQVHKLVEKSGLPATKLMTQLFELSFSRWLEKPLHVVLIGDQTKAGLLLEQFAELLPKQEFVSPPVLTERTLFEQNQSYWSHKLVIGQSLNTVTERSYLFKLIVNGSVERLSQKRKTADVVQGPIQLIGTSTNSNHVLLDLPNVIGLSIEDGIIDQEIMLRQLNVHSGNTDGVEEERAKKLLQEFQQIDKPTSVVNSLLQKLNLIKHFLGEPEQLQRFLTTSATMAVASRNWKIGCQVNKEDMLQALAILKEMWDTELGLSDSVSQTFNVIVQISKRKKQFGVSDIRKKLPHVGSRAVRKHLETLMAKQMINRIGGKQATGFIYELLSEENHSDNSKLWNELENLLNNLK